MVIVVDEDDNNNPQSPSSKTDSTFVPPTPILQSFQSPPPPSYQVSQQPIAPAPSSSSGVDDYLQPLLPKELELREDRASSRSALKRFFKAFAIALLIYILIGGLISSMVAPHGYRDNKPGKGRSDGDGDPDDGGGDTTKPPEWPGHGTWSPRKDCPPIWSSSTSSSRLIHPKRQPPPQSFLDFPELPPIHDAPYTQTLSFDLDPSAPSHLLVAVQTWGEVTFASRSSSGKDMRIGVDVTAHYYTEEALERARVCKIEKRDGGEGVGIWVPNLDGHKRIEDRVSFSLVVTFPIDASSPTNPPMQIRSFETSLPLFTHHLQAISRAVYFDNLKLFSSNMQIRGDHVYARTLDVQTSNAQILGLWKAYDTVKLITANAPIQVEVSLVERDDEETSHATLKTFNAPLTVQLHLGDLITPTTVQRNSGGRFSINAETGNAHSLLSFLSSPSRAFLDVTSATYNSNAEVRLHPLFEGRYHLQTAPVVGRNILNWETRGQERDGKQRKNQVVRSGTKGITDGKVSWGDWEEGKEYYGSVDIRSTVGNVELTI